MLSGNLLSILKRLHVERLRLLVLIMHVQMVHLLQGLLHAKMLML